MKFDDDLTGDDEVEFVGVGRGAGHRVLRSAEGYPPNTSHYFRSSFCFFLLRLSKIYCSLIHPEDSVVISRMLGLQLHGILYNARLDAADVVCVGEDGHSTLGDDFILGIKSKIIHSPYEKKRVVLRETWPKP